MNLKFRKALSLFCAAALTLGAGVASAKTLNMGTLPQGSVAYSIAAAIASAAGDRGASTRVVPQGGPVVVLPMVNRGVYDFTVTPSIPLAYAHAGEAMFKGKPQQDLRAVAVLLPLRVGILVRADSDIQSLEDLRGKRVAGGFPRQRALLKMQEAVLATAGMSMDDVQEVPVPAGVRGLDELASGKVDAAIFSVGSGAVAQADAAVRGGLRFLPIPGGEKAERAMQRVAPSSYFLTVQPADGIAALDEPTNLLASSLVLTANARVSDKDVRMMLETLLEKTDDIAQTHGAFRLFKKEDMGRDVVIPYHPAAEAFLKEQGLR
ncbi:TAXI family TRAP transporter solute-binding subunit [Alkalilimnicola sp. S0819]|uniref:TAXI family TRAP transporter solute-binding subunit n=1 Tax=Alkalilimnicola sp. S0819 TaxID=2613922 RepID=UPI001261BB24|nr:TAXI family TRAP transporter solute-binding subunit [Alkalilimnicola sp. S0819]KAB7619513.1 TAXI family TRAP transporter solute-binding subunit [Alkalilimnicola sp. S0819]MPQ17661.1 TAXI family TRAP transporter solute-binding subunit [Alkalilimnicola sp. S0819]